jgi:hypothetical protein
MYALLFFPDERTIMKRTVQNQISCTLQAPFRYRHARIVAMATLFTVIALVHGTTRAQTTQVNGCGSNFSHYIVPDRFAGCNMKEACDAHDRCYAKCVTPAQIASDAEQCFYRTCESGGANSGSEACRGKSFAEMKLARGERRVTCDEKFFVDIVNTNQGKPVCRAIGQIYKVAVRVLADSSFFGTTVSTGTLSDDQREAYKEALSQFLMNASEAEIVRLGDETAASTATVDLSKPLAYDKNANALRNLDAQKK